MEVGAVSSVGWGRQSEGTEGHEEVGCSGYEHAEAYLDWSLRLFAYLGEGSEDGYADRGEHDYEAGVELLEDRCADSDCGVVRREHADDEAYACCHKDTCYDAVETLGLEETEKSIDDEDAGQKVAHVEEHGLHACGRGGCVVAGKEGQGESVLVEGHPEEDHYGEDEAEAHDALFCLSW